MMTFASQYESVAHAIAERIRHGDYNLRRFPGTRALADEFRVSHMVARQAVSKLVSDGVLVRPNKSRQPIPVAHHRRKHTVNDKVTRDIAFLSPAFQSPLVDHLRRTLTQAASRAGINVQSVEFGHWNDPVLFDALRNFGSAFLVDHGDNMPESIAQRLGTEDYRLVSLVDLTRFNIPRLKMFDRRGVEALLQHLAALGHRVIDCINLNPVNDSLQSRMNDWQECLSELNLAGRLINRPVPVYERTLHGGYRVMLDLIDTGAFNSTALFCTTEEAAIGITRALRDRNLSVPFDVSIVTISDIGYGAYVHPSLTAVELPDVRDIMDKVLHYLSTPETSWTSPLEIRPPNPQLRIAESSGPSK